VVDSAANEVLAVDTHEAREAVVRFGVFDADLRSGELRKQGVRVKLQEQPFQILRILLERPGEVVTREEVRQSIWPADTFVDFDHGLNNAIRRLREALGDTADTPRFIETLPKRGYRFIAPVNGKDGAGEVPSREARLPHEADTASRGRNLTRTTSPLMAGVAAVLMLLIALGLVNRNRRWMTAGSNSIAIRSLAVLPLQNLSGDPTQEYFSDAMTEELITELSRLSALKVISRTSVMRYKKTDKRLPEIAQELGVDGIVEGSVLRSGDRVRITVQLVYAPKDTNVWVKTYDRDLRDVLALQSAVASAIANEIQLRMTPAEQARNLVAHARPLSPKALDAYLAGRFHLNYKIEEVDFMRGQEAKEEEERTKALHFFEEAVKADPDYAPAHLGVAETLFPADDAERSKRARIEATRAIELDDSLAEAHFLLAEIRAVYDWDWAGAEAELKRVIEVDPNSAAGHDEYGYFLDSMGRLDEALREHQKAQELDPVVDHIGGELYFRQEWNLERDLGVKRFCCNNELYYRAVEYERLGMEKEAIAEWARFGRHFGYDRLSDLLLQTYSKSGYRAALQALVKAMEKEPGADGPGFLAHFYGELNDSDRAFAYLEKCYESHGDLQFLKVDPFWSNNLRSDPRFADLVRRVGLPN
jgi:TolB-like protein/DNA-binding winged helix-turn-helix (wHTH) protein